MAICCCSMAGTANCKHCPNNYEADRPYYTNTIVNTTGINTSELFYIPLPPEPTEEQKRQLVRQWFPSVADLLDEDTSN